MTERWNPPDPQIDPETEEIHHNCAIVGVYTTQDDPARELLNGLIALNHRGQEGAGIGIANEEEFAIEKDSGLAEVVFTTKKPLPHLKRARAGVAQDRYTTSGTDSDTQPFLEDGIALAHNGNLTNISWLRKEYHLPSTIEGAQSDSRAALAVINKMPGNEKDRILAGVKRFEGAYSMIFATKGEDSALYASRDPLGFRPLSLGKLSDQSGYAVASEDVAFRSMSAEFIRDLQPGETIMINEEGVTTIGMDIRSQTAKCIFELIYIGRPDSTIFGTSVYEFRSRQGDILSRHLPDVDVIMPVPRSGIAPAQGVGNSVELRSRGILYQDGIYTNPYINVSRGPRTFIQPNQRDQAAQDKYSIVENVVKGKRVAIIDDSIVRGSLRRVVEKLRAAGALEVHALVASPPIKHACFMGVDFGKGELLANTIPDLEERAHALDLDSLYHLSYAELIEAALGNKVEESVGIDLFENNNFCGACFTGKYPVDVSGVIPRTKS